MSKKDDKLKFSNPMMDDDDEEEEADGAGAVKADNPLEQPLSPPVAGDAPMSAHQVEMDEYFAEEENAEDLDKIVPALMLYYLFEDSTCTLPAIAIRSPPTVRFLCSAELTPARTCGTDFTRFGKKGLPMKLVATVISIGINVLILVSTFAFVASTIPNMSEDAHKNPEDYEYFAVQWMVIEYICVGCFTVDVLVRGGAGYKAGKWGDFSGDVMNWIDVFAILPFYVQLIVPNGYDLRFLRVIRLARILKLMEKSGYGNVGGTIYAILSGSATALVVPLYFALLALIVCSALMYRAESTVSMTCVTALGTFENWDSSPKSPGNEGCTSTTGYGCSCAGEIVYITGDGAEWSSEIFPDIFDCFWWCLVTFTTVGYGDLSPRTGTGQWVNTVTMVLGIFFLSMPISIVGEAFTSAWGKVEALRREQKVEDAAADEAAESLVRGFGEPATELRSIGVTEHDINRHMGRARNYLVTLSTVETSTNEKGEKYAQCAADLLGEAEEIFAGAVQMFKDRGLEAKQLKMHNTTQIKGEGKPVSGVGALGTADQTLTGLGQEAQDWAEANGDITMRVGAKVTGKAASVGYGISKKAAAAAGGVASKGAGAAAAKATGGDDDE